MVDFSPAQRDRNRPVGLNLVESLCIYPNTSLKQRERPYTSSEFTTIHRLCDSVAPLDRTKNCPDAPSGDGIRERITATFLKCI